MQCLIPGEFPIFILRRSRVDDREALAQIAVGLAILLRAERKVA
jgi:hypothetical protein